MQIPLVQDLEGGGAVGAIAAAIPALRMVTWWYVGVSLNSTIPLEAASFLPPPVIL